MKKWIGFFCGALPDFGFFPSRLRAEGKARSYGYGRHGQDDGGMHADDGNLHGKDEGNAREDA